MTNHARLKPSVLAELLSRRTYQTQLVSTGWFGRAKHYHPDGHRDGKPPRFTITHIVFDGKPICGTRIGTDMAYQWCSNGVTVDYLECQRCMNNIEVCQWSPQAN